MLKGEYVILRALEMDDVAIMMSWENDREVAKYINCLFHPSQIKMVDFIKNINKEKNRMEFIIETEDEIPIGMCSLSNIDQRNCTAEINATVYAKSCWGRGYGFDAINTLTEFGLGELNLNTIYSMIIQDNDRAIKCFQKAGYEIEGILKSRIYKDGNFKDMVSMSISISKNDK